MNRRSSYIREVEERFCAHRLAVAGVIVLAVIVAVIVLLPAIFDLDPYTIDVMGGFNKPPSQDHLLGTDSVGRDILARLIYGGRVSIGVGLISTVISMVLGMTLGMLAGYFRGWIEVLIMRSADVFMSFPSIMLILVLATIVGPSAVTITIILGILGWTQFARLFYSRIISVREMEFIESARAIGCGDLEIMLRYILPNAVSPCIVAMTFRTASAMLMESSLSFLGMGVRPPMASWGNMMREAESITVLTQQPWVWIAPGLCIVLTVLSINFFGDGLRDALDPKMKL